MSLNVAEQASKRMSPAKRANRAVQSKRMNEGAAERASGRANDTVHCTQRRFRIASPQSEQLEFLLSGCSSYFFPRPLVKPLPFWAAAPEGTGGDEVL